MDNKIKKIIKYVVISIIMYGLAFLIMTKIPGGWFRYILMFFLSFIISLISMKIIREPFSWGGAIAGTLLILFFASIAIVLTAIFIPSINIFP